MLAKIETRKKGRAQLPAKTPVSTQPDASGTAEVISREASILPRSGRTTKTALKASRPITPTSSPPTHPEEKINKAPDIVLNNSVVNLDSRKNIFPEVVQSSPRNLLLDIPTINQLNNYPNLSLPIPRIHAKVILPNSAPTSPARKKFISLSEGELITPSSSPNQTSVIQLNPTFLPVRPDSQPQCSTPVNTFSEQQGGSQVGSWDNFLEEPTFLGNNYQFWESRAKQKTIPIVSTDVSDFDEPSLEQDSSILTVDLLKSSPAKLDIAHLESQLLEINLLNTQPTMSAEKVSTESNLRDLDLKVRDLCSDLSPSLITTHSAPSMNNELKEIASARDEFRNGVRNLLKTFRSELTQPEIDQWNADLDSTVKLVQAHKFSVLEKVNQLLPPVTPMSEFEKESIELQKRQLKLQEDAISSQKTEALAIAKPLKTLLLDKCTELEEELGETPVTTLQSGDDQLVTKVMLRLGSWRIKMDSIRQTYQDFQTKTAVHKLDSSDHSAVDAAVLRVKDSLTFLETTAEEEDDKRQLFSLDTSARNEQVKWPVFSGDAGEDFSKFKKDFLDAAKQNKTSTRNQITKLKENLRGYAKTLIPASITDISAGLKILEQACGDSIRVVTHRVNNLLKIGPWPAEGSKDCYSRQIKWIVNVQILLQEIIDLANSDEAIGSIIYNKEKLAHILKLFPPFLVDKLAKGDGYKEDKYKEIISKLDEAKQISRNRELIYGNSNPSDGAKSQSALPNNKPEKPPTGHTTFPQPKRFVDCRICKALQAQGSQSGLFVNHISDYATGCPKFAALGTEQRLVIVKEAKMCPKCMGKDVTSSRDHFRNCPVNKKKNSYSCKSDACAFHMWLCSRHPIDNRDQMEKFAERLRTKSGINLVFMVNQKVKLNDLSPPKISENTVNTPLPEPPDFVHGSSTHSFCNKPNSGVKRAVRKMHRFNKKSNPDIETISPPQGTALFMFQAVEGLQNPVNVFYDCGCSDAIFRSGIPGVELKGTLLNKGPFNMGGVGDISTVAEDEWLVQFSRLDGKKQLVKGVTMKQITCEFPLIDTSKAVEEIKSSFKSDTFLQSCSVPLIVGGKVDVLLGIQYLNIYPEAVRQLDCGLTIFKSKLQSHDKSMDSIIGGPHSSFQFLADKVGNPEILLAHFVEGLKSLRQFGPPNIPSNPLTADEERFSVVQNLLEEKSYFQSVQYQDEANISMKKELCSICLFQLLDDEPETLKEIKHLRLEQECGIDINYRCPKCRDCSSCKDSSRSEAISLREEAEMELIDASVSLDLENKRISCSLPLKGDERQYLSSNYAQALKILEQQVKQYSGKEETRLLIIKAFEKLFVNGHAALLEDIPESEKAQFLHKEIQYFIPWRIAFSDSVSTPARPVLDASSRTRMRPDGSGGKSLNDLVCRGKVETLNLLKLILNFRVGKFAMTGDLMQFYNACKLNPNQWNLQRFLFKENLDPSSPVKEGAIKTLIYGVSSVSAQSENSMKKLGILIQDSKPDVKKLIDEKRFCDDIADSKDTLEKCEMQAISADEAFGLVGLVCKSWNFSGRDPNIKSSKDGVSLGVGGFKWFSKLDTIQIKIPPLHFAQKRRGKLPDDTKFFLGGDLQAMDSFVPNKLNRKMVSSKFASIFDFTGKLGPVLSEAKDLLRDTVMATPDWTTAMPEELRSKWLKQFHKWEQLRSLQFSRAVMPEDAVDCKLRIIAKADSTLKLHVMGTWGGFKRKNGQWSCQHILSRNLLAEKNTTIPKGELQSLSNASNLCWMVRKLLSEWAEDYILCSDSVIALCWVSSEKKSLSMFHRNRVIQTRRGSDLNRIYHVSTEQNLADLGTRPDKVKLTDVGPESVWECGLDWMRCDIESAIASGILTPINQLRLTEERDSDDYKQGLVFDSDPPDMFCNVSSNYRVEQLQQRVEYSNYLILPTKFGFRKLVRIYALVFTFIKKCRSKPISNLEKSGSDNKQKFSVFHSVHIGRTDSLSGSSLLNYFCDGHTIQEKLFVATQTYLSKDGNYNPSDTYLDLALTYLYQKATAEVVKFNSKLKVEKVATSQDGILISKSRILDSMNFVETGGLELPDLKLIGLKSSVPVIDRFSPLAYCIANYVHWCMAKHKGVETCNRISLCHVFILQSGSLFKEISEECLRCRIKRKKSIEVPMGPISDHQLRICPPFWASQLDLFGPIQVFVPGYEKNTRGRNSLAAKCWVMTFVCPVTRLTNLQVIEKCDHSGIIDGITRLSCEVGIPKFIMIDQDAAILKALQGVEFDYLDTKFKLHTDWGIEFSTCSVAGHNEHGHVERKIRSIQESLSEAGLHNKRLHATGLQTLLKLIENQLNNLPLGYSFGNDHDNTPLLKMISPNMLRVGRNNERALDGPMRLPVGGGELLREVEKIYTSWFRIWNASYVPKLFFQPKWFRQERDLEEGNIVLFQKKEGELENAWSLGKIDQLVRGRDGMVRRVIIQYQNAKENFTRTSDRSVRSLIRIWAIDDQNIDEDLGKLESRLKSSVDGSQLVASLVSQGSGYVHGVSCAKVSTHRCSSSIGDVCCCPSHCSMGHMSVPKSSSRILGILLSFSVHDVPSFLQVYSPVHGSEANSDEDVSSEVFDDCECSVTSLIQSTNLNLH